MAQKPPVESLSREELMALVRELERKNAELRKENQALRRPSTAQPLHFPRNAPSKTPRSLAARRAKVHSGGAKLPRRIHRRPWTPRLRPTAPSAADPWSTKARRPRPPPTCPSSRSRKSPLPGGGVPVHPVRQESSRRGSRIGCRSVRGNRAPRQPWAHGEGPSVEIMARVKAGGLKLSDAAEMLGDRKSVV